MDPNRSFGSDEATHTEESAAVIALLASLGVEGSSEEGANPGWVCHVDCHETTDTDESEFMPARAALGGSVYKPCDIPDGFYLVGDSNKPQLEWHKVGAKIQQLKTGDEDTSRLRRLAQICTIFVSRTALLTQNTHPHTHAWPPRLSSTRCAK